MKVSSLLLKAWASIRLQRRLTFLQMA
ncbi:unnamed protein product [Victoria cruziana]